MEIKIRNFLITGFIAALMIWSQGCRKAFFINGNGHVVTETRQMLSFNKIINEGPFHVFVKKDTVYQVIVEAESNLIPYIRTMVNGNTLIVDTRENMTNHSPMNVYVSTPFINGVYLNGSGSFSLDSLDTDNLEIDLSGSGQVSGYAHANFISTDISGSGNINLEVYSNSINTKISGSGEMELAGKSFSGSHIISGSGSIMAYNLIQNECIAKISGSGNMYFSVSDLLDVTISGSGSVYYKGDPTVNIKITGSGSVIKQ